MIESLLDDRPRSAGRLRSAGSPRSTANFLEPQALSLGELVKKKYLSGLAEAFKGFGPDIV